MWLDASNINANNNSGLNDNNEISSWLDLSANQSNVTQASSESRPKYVANSFNGLAGVRFDGSNDYIWTESSNSLSKATIIVVTKLGNIDFSSSTNSGGAAVSIQQNGSDNFDAIVYHEHGSADRKFMHGSSGNS